MKTLFSVASHIDGKRLLAQPLRHDGRHSGLVLHQKDTHSLLLCASVDERTMNSDFTTYLQGAEAAVAKIVTGYLVSGVHSHTPRGGAGASSCFVRRRFFGARRRCTGAGGCKPGPLSECRGGGVALREIPAGRSSARRLARLHSLDAQIENHVGP